MAPVPALPPPIPHAQPTAAPEAPRVIYVECRPHHPRYHQDECVIEINDDEYEE